jgi:hypothetical protein
LTLLSNNYLISIKDWLVNFWLTEDIQEPYKIALIDGLSHLWKSSNEGIKRKEKISLIPLPMYCCSALGKNPYTAIEINAAWSLFYAGAFLLDKVEDQEILDAPIHAQPGVMINITTGFILSANLILSNLDRQNRFIRANHSQIESSFYRMLLAMCAGQHVDLLLQDPNLPIIWSNISSKSGTFFSLGCLTGSLVATNQPEYLQAFESYGRLVGILLQIGNDIEGLWGAGKGQSDLSRGQMTLPVAYAYQVLSNPEAKRLSQLLRRARSDEEAEREARSIILGCGALVYLLLESERLRQEAENTIKNLHLQTEDALTLLMIPEQLSKLWEERHAARD